MHASGPPERPTFRRWAILREMGDEHRAVCGPYAAVSHRDQAPREVVRGAGHANDTVQIGDASGREVVATPLAVPSLEGVVALAAGSFHTCGIVADGSVRCWVGRRRRGAGDRQVHPAVPRHPSESWTGSDPGARCAPGGADERSPASHRARRRRLESLPARAFSHLSTQTRARRAAFARARAGRSGASRARRRTDGGSP
jgi:Regulator of chromosome condensation (RCC1) repeat